MVKMLCKNSIVIAANFKSVSIFRKIIQVDNTQALS